MTFSSDGETIQSWVSKLFELERFYGAHAVLDLSDLSDPNIVRSLQLISGASVVGTLTENEELSLSGPVFEVTPDTVTYQWYRTDNDEVDEAITDADAATYTLVTADAGLYVYCVVTSSNRLSTVTVTTEAVGPVAAAV